MRRYRVLLLAELANPEWVSVPLVGWSHANALRELVDAHIVTQVRSAAAFERAGLIPGRDFTAVDSEVLARPLYKLGTFLAGGAGKGWTTSMATGLPAYYYFEHLVWKIFRDPIRAGHYDLVHRLTPLSPTYPSPIARKCRAAGVPFLLGPLNGGLPWPKGFERVRHSEREWLSHVREVYKLAPRYRSTRRDAAALLIGSVTTWNQVSPRFHHKCVYIPENAIDPDRFPPPPPRPGPSLPVRVTYVGRLVPGKSADLLIEAAAPLLREGKLFLDLLGDGPEMPRLRSIVESLQVQHSVSLPGWVPHGEVHKHLAATDCFGFPSIREFGGGAVLEAMAMGAVPIIVDYGGPAELVTERTGFKVPLCPPNALIGQLRAVLERIVADPGQLRPMGLRARERVLRHFTWHAKAAQTFEIYRWVLGDRPEKPDFGMPFDD